MDSPLDIIEAEITDIMKFNDSIIMAIPSIGYINGRMILGEIGNIHLSCPRTSEEAADLTEEQFLYLMMELNPLNPKVREVTPQKPT